MWFAKSNHTGYGEPMEAIDARNRFCILNIVAACLGCVTDSPNKPAKGPDGTIAYEVAIEASETGARIEVNDDFVGHTPFLLTVHGDADGTFHNFGSKDFLIRVFPPGTNGFTQTKVFRTGGWFSEEDRIPKRLFFDLRQLDDRFSIDQKPRY